jgi:hypothetical protein
VRIDINRLKVQSISDNKKNPIQASTPSNPVNILLLYLLFCFLGIVLSAFTPVFIKSILFFDFILAPLVARKLS